MIDVGRDECRIERKRMCRNGGIEILNPRSTAFQGRLDAAEHLADRIGPLGSWELPGDEIEPRLQRRPALRPRQTFDAKRDFCKHGLGTEMSAGAVAANRSMTAVAPFMSADTAFVSRT